MGFGYSGWGSSIHPVWWIFKAALFVLAIYVFSYIFWATKKQLDKQPKKKK